jgi:VWFA-related protein
MTKGALVFLGAALALASAAAQQPTFRSSVDLVTIDVVATTANGAPVANLTADDFEVFEDGVAQKVQTFQFVDLASASAIRPLPPGIASNEVEPGGLFVVVIDELGLQIDDIAQARRVADKFFKETLLPNDYVAIVRSGANSGFFLTSDRTLALSTIPQARGLRERNLGLESPGGAATTTGAPPPDIAAQLVELDSEIEVFGPGENGRQSFKVLFGVVEQLRRIPARRKAVLWFSRGGDLPANFFEWFERPKGTDDDVLARLVDAARAANVAIYSVDPRGLQAPGADVGRDGQPFDTTVVRDIAGLTGGRALLGNDASGALARVAAENRAYYLLGYAPATNAKNGARKLTVRTRAPGVSLLHRRVYTPTAEGGATALSLVESALPVSDLPIALAPSAVAGEGDRRGIIVPFEIGQDLPDGANVNYTVVALDPEGKIGARAIGTVQAKDGHAIGEARLAVEAKIYQVRVAATVVGAAPREGLAFATVVAPAGRAKVAECSGFVFEQPGDRPGLRSFPRGAPMTISTMISADKIDERAITIGIGSAGGPVERSWPVQLGKPLSKGLWRVALSLKPPLPGGHVEIRVMEDGLLLNENCRTEFVLR